MTKLLPRVLSVLCLVVFSPKPICAEDIGGTVKKAVEKSTLDQPGTKPFHLKATYAPSFERDKDSNRVGEIEIWWQSPTKWRRELSSPEFHQIAIIDGAHQWQKNDGDYFPEWLRELSQAIVRPVPLSTEVLLQRVKTAEVRHLSRQTNIDWKLTTEFPDGQSNSKGYLALGGDTGLLWYTGGSGWNGLYRDFKDFHGRIVAYTISSGRIEVTAKLGVLEDLGNTPAGFFDTNAPGGDPQPIETVVLGERELRANLTATPQFSWPPLAQGPLEGGVGTEMVIDRTGKIRELAASISDNPGIRDSADQQFRALQFHPFLRDGVPVQAVAAFSVPFKTVRPAGIESFDSARNYFERGRKISCLGAGANAPYTLYAEFQAANSNHEIQTGRYEDTSLSPTQWKREAWFGSSHLVRSQNGDKRYVLTEGPEAGLLRLVMLIVEPIPALDTMTESDWRIQRGTVDDVKTIRVFRGYEGPNGELDPKTSQGYWFDEAGALLKSYVSGLEVRPSEASPYAGVAMPRQIDVLSSSKLAMRLTVKDIQPVAATVSSNFTLKGHEWQRAFTAEAR